MSATRRGPMRRQIRLGGFLIAATLVLAWGVAVPPASAQSKWWKSERYRQLLQLTANQSEQLELIHETMSPQLRTAKQALDEQEARFSSLLQRDDSTESEVIRAIDALEAARGQLSKLRTLHVYRMRQVLTPQQRDTLEADFQESRRRAESSTESSEPPGSP